VHRWLGLALALTACSPAPAPTGQAAAPAASPAAGTATLKALLVPDPNHLLPPLTGNETFGSPNGPWRIVSRNVDPPYKGVTNPDYFKMALPDSSTPLRDNYQGSDTTRVLDLRGGTVRQATYADLAAGQTVVWWGSACTEGLPEWCGMTAVAILSGPQASPAPSPASASPDPAASGSTAAK